MRARCAAVGLALWLLVVGGAGMAPDRSFEGGYAPLGLPRPIARSAPAEPDALLDHRYADSHLVGLPSGATARSERLLVTVGEVTSGTAVLWARAPRLETLSLTLRTATGEASGDPRPVSVAADRDLTARVTLRDLKPATRYTYRLAGEADAVAGGFVTAPAPEDPRPVTFVWSGDLGGGGFCRPAHGYPIFRAMAARRPDFFLFVGDTIYADHRCHRPDVVAGGDVVAVTLDDFHARHRYNREDPAVQAFLRTTSVYAIWDDHEVRNNFAGPTEPLMPVGRQAFVDYWPIAQPAGEPTRLYRRFRWGRLVEVFILDTRQYRSANTERDSPGKTMLGSAQREWLVAAVTGSTAVWKVVVSSVPLSVPTGRREARDSWTNAGPWGLPDEGGTGFVHERDLVLRRLRDHGVRNLVVLAADVHHAELIRHQPRRGFVFHEFIAGPLSATTGRPRPLDEALGPRSLWARGGMHNFGEIAVDAGGLSVRIVGEDGTVLTAYSVTAE